ncbi:MAG: hypothetical protein JSR62_16065 [Nitrospira sp.]|nr:hypothetical protein [Nitrospira sp.]
MFSMKYLQISQGSKWKTLALLVLIVLPFPVGIPLAVWLTSRHASPLRSRTPLPPDDHRP